MIEKFDLPGLLGTLENVFVTVKGAEKTAFYSSFLLAMLLGIPPRDDLN
jgi:hypothetical protein